MRPTTKGKKAIKAIHYELMDRASSYKERAEQLDLAAIIYDGLDLKKHVIAEAPTGVGKSLAILMAALAKGGTTVIATANNTLLEQYVKKDLPFLERYMAQTPFAFTWGRLKGRSNYLCRERYARAHGSAAAERFGINEIYDRTHDKFKTMLPEDWAKISGNDDCEGKKCQYYNECDLYRERATLKNKRIIVTNYDIVMISKLYPNAQILPAYDQLILDEAHSLPEKALDYLGEELTWYGIRKYARRIASPLFDNYEREIDRVFEWLQDQIAQSTKEGEPKPQIHENRPHFSRPISYLAKLLEQAAGDPVSRDQEPKEVRHAKQKLDGWSKTLSAMAQITSDCGQIAWAEMHGQKGNIKLTLSPVFVAEQLREMFFANGNPPVIMTSATIAAATASGAPDFSTYAANVGVDDYLNFHCPSPFNFQGNCLLWLFKGEDGWDKPTDKRWKPWAAKQITKLVNHSKGGAFVLCTSRDSLNFMASHLRNTVSYPVMVQDGSIAVPELLNRFRNTENAVLVGTSSFWEGVSIEGDALRMVILDKIPFPVFTEPLHKAKDAYYKIDPTLKSRAFYDLMLYPAIIRLKQGFGRLIRTETDKGDVAILDPRLMSAQYRRQILNSLPECPIVTV